MAGSALVCTNAPPMMMEPVAQAVLPPPPPAQQLPMEPSMPPMEPSMPPAEPSMPPAEPSMPQLLNQMQVPALQQPPPMAYLAQQQLQSPPMAVQQQLQSPPMMVQQQSLAPMASHPQVIMQQAPVAPQAVYSSRSSACYHEHAPFPVAQPPMYFPPQQPVAPAAQVAQAPAYMYQAPPVTVVCAPASTFRRFDSVEEAHKDLAKCRASGDIEGAIKHFDESSVLRFYNTTTGEKRDCCGTSAIRAFLAQKVSEVGAEALKSLRFTLVDVDEQNGQVFSVGSAPGAGYSSVTSTSVFGLDYVIKRHLVVVAQAPGLDTSSSSSSSSDMAKTTKKSSAPTKKTKKDKRGCC